MFLKNILKMKDQIQHIADTFFEKLWVDYKLVEVAQEADHIFLVKIESTDSSILIGPHGKNIEVIKSLLKLMSGRALEENVIIHLEINDYMQQKEEKLYTYIKSKIEYVESSGKEIVLPFFTAYERKKVHSYVSENGENVYTRSEWEWADRRIHLCKKDKKMTIDIDGDDI